MYIEISYIRNDNNRVNEFVKNLMKLITVTHQFEFLTVR